MTVANDFMDNCVFLQKLECQIYVEEYGPQEQIGNEILVLLMRCGGAYSYRAEMEYSYQISDRLRLSLKADMNLLHVGKIGGELYVAAYTDYVMDESGQYVFTDGGVYGGNACDPYTTPNCFPVLQTVEAHTVKIEDSLKYATWQSFGLHLGVKYLF